MINCSVCVTACNEEKTIGALLDALLKQKLSKVTIEEIIVVASGCKDKTAQIVKDFCQKNPQVNLIQQERREGKASAINLFLSVAKCDICVLESGDTIPTDNVVEQLVTIFQDERVGLVGAHPIPVNPEDNFAGYLVGLNWRLTHELAMIKPRLGEMVAFRKIFSNIPVDTAVDEAFIESIINRQGYKIMYCPDAVVRNKGPESVSEYIMQCRRMFAGHLHLTKTTSYRVSSFNLFLISRLVFKDLMKNPSLRNILFTIGACLVELFGRFLGLIDFYVFKKNPYIWEIAKSTKNFE